MCQKRTFGMLKTLIPTLGLLSQQQTRGPNWRFAHVYQIYYVIPLIACRPKQHGAEDETATSQKQIRTVDLLIFARF